MRVALVCSWHVADVAVRNRVWGSNRSRFGKWADGETLVLLVGKECVVVATVTGKGFVSDQMIWDEDLFEYRIPIRAETIIRGGAGKMAAEAVRKGMLAGIGTGYGAYIMSQSKLPETVEKLVAAVL
jgi:hypothetical protein